MFFQHALSRYVYNRSLFAIFFSIFTHVMLRARMDNIIYVDRHSEPGLVLRHGFSNSQVDIYRPCMLGDTGILPFARLLS